MYPTTNVLVALNNIITRNLTTLPNVINHQNNNRINGVGDLLEYFVKDAFCGTSIDVTDTHGKLIEYQRNFSYLGNSNNPPDFIVRHGVAVEVKKIEGNSFSDLALNSSFPKDFLYSSDRKIKQECRTCENDFGGWDTKDMVYAVGNVSNGKIHTLWFVYGDCYCADKSTYERITNKIKDGVLSIQNVEFAETNELGRVNRVDPLGITYLRIRGMWGINHPSAVFNPYIDRDPERTNIYVLMKKEKFDHIAGTINLQPHIDEEILKYEEIQIPNPNNPAGTIDAVLFTAVLNQC